MPCIIASPTATVWLDSHEKLKFIMRTALTNADYCREYKRRKREAGIKIDHGKGGKTSKWDKGQFIALDGEGESDGAPQKFRVGSDGKTYRAASHIYTLLAASTGETLYNGGKRLDSQTCIDFLCDLGSEYKKAIFVIFAGSYDINHMLLFGFDKETLQKISRGETLQWKHDDVDYYIEYRARKSLSLKRGLEYKINDSTGKHVPVWKDKITVWDTFGFFQESFVKVMGKWLGETHRHYQLIKKMKTLRGDFENVEQKEINAYNAAELETLVELMEKVRDSINGLDLKCTRWDGAGSIAGALFRKHNSREFKRPYKIDIKLETAIRTAYAGGRIEIAKMGSYSGTVYDYDINSAYPFVMKDLPSLAKGWWKHGTGRPTPGFTLVRCRYDFAKGQAFYPLFFRTDKMQIYFPQSGEGWYWYPEYEAALDCIGVLDVIEYYHFVPDTDEKPFHWINEYYETRKKWVKNPDQEWQRGGEKIIKLGLNSLYGKTAQQLGGTGLAPPTYHQMEWAGYITACTRARLYKAAIKDPDSIIGFATDGIFSTKALNIPLSTTKEIGAWDLKTFNGLTIVMAGVYWWHKEGNKYEHFSRGFDKESMETPALVLDAWANGLSGIDIPMHRLITMGSACASDTLWKMRGRFTEGFRSLRLDGKSNKRQAINVVRKKPHKNLVDLKPAENLEYNCGLLKISHPYPIKWLDGAMTDEFENDLELQKENADTENI